VKTEADRDQKSHDVTSGPPAQIEQDPPIETATRSELPRVAEPVFETTHRFQLPEIETMTNLPESQAQDWQWNGKDWSVTERPGSTYTVQFFLRVKDTNGRWRYAAAPSLSFAEYNRRFTGKKFVANKKYKPTRIKDYEKFEEFCFETWKAQTIRTYLPFDRSATSDS
jgi:hypothetical protein